LEINASGYRHIELVTREPYPSLSVVEQAIAFGIPLVVNSDAHDPSHVGEHFHTLGPFLKDHHCHALATFTRRNRSMYPL